MDSSNFYAVFKSQDLFPWKTGVIVKLRRTILSRWIVSVFHGERSCDLNTAWESLDSTPLRACNLLEVRCPRRGTSRHFHKHLIHEFIKISWQNGIHQSVKRGLIPARRFFNRLAGFGSLDQSLTHTGSQRHMPAIWICHIDRLHRCSCSDNSTSRPRRPIGHSDCGSG